MTFLKVIEYGHHLLHQALQKGDLAVDATMGKGHDTVFLAQEVGLQGHVFAFDIQQQALDQTELALSKAGCRKQVTLIHDSHHRVSHHLPQDAEIKGAIFNLGYLPGGDKSVVTRPDTTLEAVQFLLARMVLEGVLVLVIYLGHPGGDEESEAVMNFLEALDQKQFQVLRYGFINQKNRPPYLVAVTKIK